MLSYKGSALVIAGGKEQTVWTDLECCHSLLCAALVPFHPCQELPSSPASAEAEGLRACCYICRQQGMARVRKAVQNRLLCFSADTSALGIQGTVARSWASAGRRSTGTGWGPAPGQVPGRGGCGRARGWAGLGTGWAQAKLRESRMENTDLLGHLD